MTTKNFTLKNIDDFGGPNVEEKIKLLRYEHYIERLK